MWRFGLNPYLELIYQVFEKSNFRYFRAFLGPLGPNFQTFVTGELSLHAGGWVGLDPSAQRQNKTIKKQ